MKSHISKTILIYYIGYVMIDRFKIDKKKSIKKKLKNMKNCGLKSEI